MLYQNNIDVVDDYLPDEEDNRLNAFSERCGDNFALLKIAGLLNLRSGNQDRSSNGRRDRANRSHYPISKFHQQNGQSQFGSRLQNVVARERSKFAQSLHVAALHAKRRVKRHSQREHRNEPRVRHPQVLGDWLPGNCEDDCDGCANHPCFPPEITEHRDFAGHDGIACDELRAHQLK